MPTDPDTMTRWTVTVSRRTDIALRSFLAQRGLKKGDISKFIEDAVRWRVFDQTVAEARSGFAEMSPPELQEIIAEATGQVRKEITAEINAEKNRRPRTRHDRVARFGESPHPAAPASGALSSRTAPGGG